MKTHLLLRVPASVLQNSSVCTCNIQVLVVTKRLFTTYFRIPDLIEFPDHIYGLGVVNTEILGTEVN